MTLFMKLNEEREEGREEGREKEREEMIISMYEAKLLIAQIASIAKSSEDYIVNVLNQSGYQVTVNGK